MTSPVRHVGALRGIRARGAGPSARSHDRYRRIALSAVSAIGARLFGAVAVLVSVPLVLDELGAERFGLWITMTSLVLILSFTDLGLGNGLINAIARANGRDDREAARACVSKPFFLLTAVAILVLVGFVVVAPHISWASLFNVSSPAAARDAGPAMYALFACLAVGIPLGIVQRVQIGYQEGFRASGWSAAGSVIALALIVVGVHLNAGLTWFVAAAVGGPLVAAGV